MKKKQIRASRPRVVKRRAPTKVPKARKAKRTVVKPRSKAPRSKRSAAQPAPLKVFQDEPQAAPMETPRVEIVAEGSPVTPQESVLQAPSLLTDDETAAAAADAALSTQPTKTKTRAIVGLLLNIFVLPGVGTLACKRVATGLVQIGVYIIGLALCVVGGVATVFSGGGTLAWPYAIAGGVLSIAAWIWAVITSIQIMIREEV